MIRTAEKEYIDREILLKMNFYTENCNSEENRWNDYAIKDIIRHIPAADVAPVKHGYWKPISESEMTGFNPKFAGRDPIAGYKCSNCGNEAIFSCNDEFVLSDYCPNCGAKMDGDDNT